MTSIKFNSQAERLTHAPVKSDGTRVELQGRKRLSFAGELAVKILANRSIDMMKLFPGFCDWWFRLEDERREYIFQDLHFSMLQEFPRLAGLTEQKAEQMRDCVVKYFDNVPGFTNWTKETAGADLRGRVHYQLKDHLWEEFRKI